MIRIKRIYDLAEPRDGERILIDRLWPRGVSKEKAHVDEWRRDLAPSDELRKWFNHDPAKWESSSAATARSFARNCLSSRNYPVKTAARSRWFTAHTIPNTTTQPR